MTSSVLASSARAYQALSLEDLRRIAPSVFAESARPGVSARYTFVSTAQVIELLRSEGWEPVKAGEQRVRLAARRGFQLHELRFTRRIDLGLRVPAVGEVRPEMVLQNAHDGTHAYRIDAGLYRLVCRNGLVVADAEFAHVAIRHVDVSAERFVSAAAAVADATPRVLETVARWQSVQLTPAARTEFARRAAALRWHPGQSVGDSIAPESLLRPIRYGDDRNDLWTVANLIQERLTRGGVQYRTNAPGSRIRLNTTRPVGSIHGALVFNKALWGLAEQFAQN